MSLTNYLPAPILDLYEVHNFKHAAEVLHTSCPNELAELCDALMAFRLSHTDLLSPGGNESRIPKRMASLLRPHRWFETRIRGDLVVTIQTHADDGMEKTEHRIEDFLDGHKIDFVKNRVAFIWNGTARIKPSTAISTPFAP